MLIRGVVRAASIIFLFFLIPKIASANCEWTWDCATNPCQHIPMCDSTTEMVPMEPMEMAPVAPMQEMKPMEPVTMPPIGTSDCEQKYICDNGACGWQEVCE